MRKTIEQLVIKFRALSLVRRGLVLTVGAAAGFVFLAVVTRPVSRIVGTVSPASPQAENPSSLPQTDEPPITDLQELKGQVTAPAPEESRPVAREMSATIPYATPLIAHTAALSVATKEFAKSRSSLEEILEQHRGYAAKLRMIGRRSGSVLSATLRVPSTELGATVSDLKSLGDVEQEEQSADEVTQQRADLEARLSNARSTLHRLQDLLQKQTYPDGNVRELQRQIGSVTAEIQRLEAERLASEHRVIFANVQFSLREVVSTPAESLGAQLHSAAAAGFGEAAASWSVLLLFAIGRGPVVLLWIAILYFPARLVWKRWQPVAAQPTAVQGD